MVTILMMIAFGLIGSVIGEHWFDGSMVEGAIIGAVIGLIFRLLFIKGCGGSGGGFDFGDFGGFDGGSCGD
jgi:hypothetical protein